MRIGILQTDHVNDALREQHGDYPFMFERLLGGAATNWEYQAYDVMLAVPDTIDRDAYLITGSRHSVYDELPWIEALVVFIRRVLESGKKVIGICFGHQLMAHFFGGQVGPAKVGWSVGVHAVQVTTQHDWMSPDVATFALISSHQDQVLSLPEGARVFASSEFCPVAGYTMGDQVVTLQGHPEFDTDYIYALMTQRQELLGEAVYQRGVDSLSTPTDDAVLAQWIVNFVNR